MAQSDLRPKSRKSISDKIVDPFLPNYFKISLLKPGWSLAEVNLTFPPLLNPPDTLKLEYSGANIGFILLSPPLNRVCPPR
jgi:hypothetical protein